MSDSHEIYVGIDFYQQHYQQHGCTRHLVVWEILINENVLENRIGPIFR